MKNLLRVIAILAAIWLLVGCGKFEDRCAQYAGFDINVSETAKAGERVYEWQGDYRDINQCTEERDICDCRKYHKKEKPDNWRPE